MKAPMMSLFKSILAVFTVCLATGVARGDDSCSAVQKNDAVLFVGSSSIQRWKTLTEDFPGVKVVNCGVGGFKIPDCTREVDKYIAANPPRLVIFYAGDNDVAAGSTPEKVLQDYQAFVSYVRELAPGTPIGFISIKPSPSRAALMDTMRSANALVKQYIAHDRGQFYMDVFTPMLGTDGQPRPELFVGDKLHMNPEGYKIWQQIVAPHLH